MINRVLVFDVETTGLIKKNVPLPYITQMSFVVYDFNQQQIIKSYNYYIKIPDHVVIDPFITQLTRITHEICNTQGVDIIDALKDLYNCYMMSDCIVAHNIEFDEKMIKIEMERNRKIIEEKNNYLMLLFNDKYSKIFNIESYCTMKNNIDFCSIYFTNSKKKKYPQLIELYKKCFNQTPENLHNALNDVLICLRCYLKLRYAIDISSVQFNQLLQQM
jgi:DNA polymerase III epsilon subunit-like protein